MKAFTSRFRPRAVQVAIFGWLLVGALCVPQAGQPGGTLEGRILAADGKTPDAGARVLAVHLEGLKAYTAEPATKEGRFTLGALPYGYYQIAIESGERLLAISRPVLVEPGKRQELEISTRPSVAEAEGGSFEGILIPVIDRRATGLADIPDPERKRSRASKLGLAAGAAALLLLLLLA